MLLCGWEGGGCDECSGDERPDDDAIDDEDGDVEYMPALCSNAYRCAEG